MEKRKIEYNIERQVSQYTWHEQLCASGTQNFWAPIVTTREIVFLGDRVAK